MIFTVVTNERALRGLGFVVDICVKNIASQIEFLKSEECDAPNISEHLLLN